MLIDLRDLAKNYTLRIKGIVHVGAHLGEEAQIYDECGVKNVIWIEGNPDLIFDLTRNVERYGHQVIQALVSDRENEEVEFNIANNGQSSSLLELGTHKEEHPEVEYVGVQKHHTTTIDLLSRQYKFCNEEWNFLNLDLQGAELLALLGSSKFLKNVDYIYTEVNEKPLYEGCALIGDIDRALQAHFNRVETEMTRHGWGDAFYVRCR